LLEGDHEAVGPAAGFDEPLECGPPRGGGGDLIEALTGLLDVRGDAEADPGGGVAVGLVAAALDLLQDAVVVARVAAQVLLDGAELGRK